MAIVRGERQRRHSSETVSSVDVVDALLVRAIEKVDGHNNGLLDSDAADMFGQALDSLAADEATDQARLFLVIGPAMQCAMRLTIAISNHPLVDHTATAVAELTKMRVIKKRAAEAAAGDGWDLDDGEESIVRLSRRLRAWLFMRAVRRIGG